MKERPILFSAPMVRAILDGSKSQTRRVCQPAERAALSFVVDCGSGRFGDEEGAVSFGCPYGAPGDRLWIRETWSQSADQLSDSHMDTSFRYAATDERALDNGTPKPWRPSIHMPRYASRIDLEVAGVRVERLQSISEADAIAEGLTRHACGAGWNRYGLAGDSEGLRASAATGTIPTAFPVLAYRALWERINGPGSWDANPWVWVVEFRRIRP